MLSSVRIILVEPAGELNIGAIARIMKNMALERLILVNPKCDPFSETAQIMAVHAIDVLTNAQVMDSLPLALKGCHLAIATTNRPRAITAKLETPTQLLPSLLAKNIQSAIIFGSEERGLSNEELQYAHKFMMIPANPAYPSLNLAQAVAVTVAELYKIATQKTEINNQENQLNIAPLQELEGYYQNLETTLLKINYLQPHTVKVKMEKFRRIFNRAELNSNEVAMLRGILRQIEWAIAKDIPQPKKKEAKDCPPAPKFGGV